MRDGSGRGGKRTVAVGGARADVHCLLPADHARRAVELLRQGDLARPDRRAARAGSYCFGSALAAAWRALHLCDDENLSLAVRARHAASAAGFRALEDAGLLSKEKLLAGDIPAIWVSDSDGRSRPARRG